MTIIERQKVRAAYQRAIELHSCTHTAAHAVAQALCLPVEAVLECVEDEPSL